MASVCKTCEGVGCGLCLVKDKPAVKECSAGMSCQHPRCVAFRKSQRSREVDELMAKLREKDESNAEGVFADVETWDIVERLAELAKSVG